MGVVSIKGRNLPLRTECGRNSIHIAICFWVRPVFLRAASLAPDQCENVQNCGDTANVSSNTHEPIFHARMFVRQDFNMCADTPQPINLPQKILENRSHGPTVGRRGRLVHSGIDRFSSGVNLKAKIFYQTQRGSLAKKGKKQSEQVRNEIDSALAVLTCASSGFNFVESAQVSIGRYFHGTEPWRFRLGKGQGTGSERLKPFNSYRCAELPPQPLIHPDSGRLRMKSRRCCISLGSNEAARQFTCFAWRKHRFHSFFIRDTFALSVQHLSLRPYHGECFCGQGADAIRRTHSDLLRSIIT